MRVLVIDNYDSFTFNLVHMVKEIGGYEKLDVLRNDKFDLEFVKDYDKILISPGPGIPDHAGIMKEVVKKYASSKSILGVCLGHQGIAEVFGARIFNLPEVLHGIPGDINIVEDDYLFKGVDKVFSACHYHSWAVDPATLNGSLYITATGEDDLVMGISHKEFDVKGVQFHPESIITPEGKKIIKNWLTH